MTASGNLLAEAFGRIQEVVHDVVDDLTTDELCAHLDEGSNTIAWLVWHLTRIQDDHVADAAGTDQVWTAQDWSERFALPYPASATGFGHSSRDVARLKGVSPELLTGYHDAVHDRTVGYVRGLTGTDLDEVIDESWDPPVTRGVRLVSVITDDLQHAGQAAFIRGALERR